MTHAAITPSASEDRRGVLSGSTMQISKITSATVDIKPLEHPSSSKHRPTCPFASLVSPADAIHSEDAVAITADTNAETTAATTTVNVSHRQCPRWVRVLRFSARYVAKQVLLRSAKNIFGHAMRSMCPALQAAPKQL
ncbi:hypothetical protein BWQ96_02305 [Gracilariopsis chorda]|uniref:Uncharacterized protein n=1 Tax=Gracilariopsis chorda TaxID=448386 RepID=A0A2V3J0P1_9FLOR|nr:hypothetical protein BWQ96_02305 [Gracilariopsis chorda]|eukprot:PXF47919.1 hypothetical protein BWQ96_02305 [Gracilariopsis chorda]